MRALLLKDWYTLTRQLRLALPIMLIFAVLPGFSTATFAVLFASMMPVTTLAYDEHAKWDELAMTMPWSVGQIVGAKYVLSLLLVGAAGLLSAAAGAVTGIIRHQIPDAGAVPDVIGVACVGLLVLAITLPFMFRLGVEKGRIVLMILMGGLMLMSIGFLGRLESYLGSIRNPALPIGVLALVTAAALAVSVPVSVRQYRARRR